MERIRLAAPPPSAGNLYREQRGVVSQFRSHICLELLEQAPAEPTQRPGFMMASEPFDESFQAPGAPLEGRGIDDAIGIQQECVSRLEFDHHFCG